MRRILMAAVALTAVTATPAYSQAVFNVSGTVNAVCDYTGGTIAFGTIGVNPDGTIATGQSASSSAQTGFYCNGAGTTLDLTHTTLTTVATPPNATFTNTIDYTPAVAVGSADQQVGDGTGVAFGAQAGSLVVDARNLTATGKLMAGTYNGTITLTLTPTS